MDTVEDKGMDQNWADTPDNENTVDGENSGLEEMGVELDGDDDSEEEEDDDDEETEEEPVSATASMRGTGQSEDDDEAPTGEETW